MNIYWDTGEDWDGPEAGVLEVTVEENPVVGVLLGPSGEPLVEVRERRTIPLGFHG